MHQIGSGYCILDPRVAFLVILEHSFFDTNPER